jgi:hypothetical protein
VERVAEIAVQFEFADGATISFGDPLEVALDCPICRRCWRTVVFHEGHTEGKCTPTGHSFHGYIIAKEEAQSGPVASVIYRVRYSYEPFTDAKYPGVRETSGEPTWGRVAFEVACSRCGHITKASTQTNIRRPWASRCECGCVLYTEWVEQPVLTSTEWRGYVR